MNFNRFGKGLFGAILGATAPAGQAVPQERGVEVAQAKVPTQEMMNDIQALGKALDRVDAFRNAIVNDIVTNRKIVEDELSKQENGISGLSPEVQNQIRTRWFRAGEQYRRILQELLIARPDGGHNSDGPLADKYLRRQTVQEKRAVHELIGVINGFMNSAPTSHAARLWAVRTEELKAGEDFRPREGPEFPRDHIERT